MECTKQFFTEEVKMTYRNFNSTQITSEKGAIISKDNDALLANFLHPLMARTKNERLVYLKVQIVTKKLANLAFF